jgi:hypothetical protein
MIRVSGDGVDFSCPAAEVRLSDGVGSVCRTIRFADGGVCEIVDTGMVAALESCATGRPIADGFTGGKRVC